MGHLTKSKAWRFIWLVKISCNSSALLCFIGKYPSYIKHTYIFLTHIIKGGLKLPGEEGSFGVEGGVGVLARSQCLVEGGVWGANEAGLPPRA